VAARLLQEFFRFAVLKTTLGPETGEIRSSPAGELLTERGMSPLQYFRRFTVMKALDTARPPGPCGSRCPQAPVKANEVGFSKLLGCYRELVDLEIGRASEHGARWWSRRLVQVYEEAGLVRLDK
jgi:hypothetical protein